MLDEIGSWASGVLTDELLIGFLSLIIATTIFCVFRLFKLRKEIHLNHDEFKDAFDEKTDKLLAKISNISVEINNVVKPQDILELKFFVQELHDLTIKISDNFYNVTQQYQNQIEHPGKLNTENLKPRSVFWTPELATQFWKAVSNSRLDELSFAAVASAALIRIIQPLVKKDAVILDFGGGNGAIAKKLFGLGFSCDLYDPSAERLSPLRKEDQLSGAFDSTAKITSNRYDLIIACEVMEHLVVGAFSEAMAEIRRILKPGGVLFITTPNNEDLELGYALDPVSGRYFHRWQHVRQFTEESMANILSLYGLAPKALATINISNQSHVKKLSDHFSALSDRVSNQAQEPVKLHGVNGANLVFLAQKPLQTPTDNEMPTSSLGFLSSRLIKLDLLIEHVEGYMYSCPVPTLSGVASTQDRPSNSALVLLEDGEPLTYQNAPHSHIRDVGLGSYSHWSECVYFSSSDNSAVDRNGRSYALSLSHWTDIE
jgi:2-polyprenyl-3-methyl-5-hydroxy-6-metoxy-1,4-benzoquinol methylase